MSFVSWCFLTLLAVVLAGRIVLSRRKTGWPYLGLLLGASLAFYGWFFLPFLGLLLLSTAIDYSTARLMDRPAMSPKARRSFLALSVISNLAILATFKYANFAALTLEQAFGYFGWAHQLPRSHLGLPMGISFYTFVALGYTVDIYRGTMRAERNFFRFLLFVAFFPHLMAGPIGLASKNWTSIQAALMSFDGCLFSKATGEI
jgi:D-alanyl-lipoteichoic acid acyltransferase DltB (MBOAT superfamily)